MKPVVGDKDSTVGMTVRKQLGVRSAKQPRLGYRPYVDATTPQGCGHGVSYVFVQLKADLSHPGNASVSVVAE